MKSSHFLRGEDMQPQTVSRNFWLHSRSDTTIHVYEKSLLGRTRKNMRNFFCVCGIFFSPGIRRPGRHARPFVLKKRGKRKKKIFLTSGRAVRPGAESPAKDIRKNVKTRTAVPRRKIAIFFRNVREIRCLVTAKLVHFLSRDWVRV